MEIYNVECTQIGVGARKNNTSAVRRKIGAVIAINLLIRERNTLYTIRVCAAEFLNARGFN